MTTTKLNKGTQKAEYYKKLYNKSTCTSIDFFYNSASSTKRRIEEAIQDKMLNNNCIGYRVLSGNTCAFTCGYTSRDGKKLYIETSGNTFEIEL